MFSSVVMLVGSFLELDEHHMSMCSRLIDKFSIYEVVWTFELTDVELVEWFLTSCNSKTRDGARWGMGKWGTSVN